MKGKLTNTDHFYWEWKPLPEINLHYEVVDGYVSYDLYSRIGRMNLRQAHLQVPEPVPMEVVCPSCKTAARSAHSIADKDPHKIPGVTKFWMDREWRWGD
jgi:hypothetical protein